MINVTFCLAGESAPLFKMNFPILSELLCHSLAGTFMIPAKTIVCRTLESRLTHNCPDLQIIIMIPDHLMKTLEDTRRISFELQQALREACAKYYTLGVYLEKTAKVQLLLVTTPLLLGEFIWAPELLGQ